MKFPIKNKKLGPHRYILLEDYVHDRRIPGIKQYSNVEPGKWDFQHGSLTIKAGFRHDSASGPTYDDDWNDAAATLHDAGYGITMALGFKDRAPREHVRKCWDLEFRRMLIEKIPDIVAKYKTHGFWGKVKTASVTRGLKIRAAYYYRAVRWFGEDAMLGKWRSRKRKAVARVCAPHMYRKVESLCAV